MKEKKEKELKKKVEKRTAKTVYFTDAESNQISTTMKREKILKFNDFARNAILDRVKIK